MKVYSIYYILLDEYFPLNLNKKSQKQKIKKIRRFGKDKQNWQFK